MDSRRQETRLIELPRVEKNRFNTIHERDGQTPVDGYEIVNN